MRDLAELAVPELTSLGPRICVIGPSSAGKSTLGVALSQKLGCKVVHLDLLAHYPDTQWQARPKPEMIALHDAELADPAWVIEGNYSSAMPQRFARATAIIWLDLKPLGCLGRYVRRTLQPASRRKGILPEAEERLNMKMVHWILAGYPIKQRLYPPLIEASGKPLLRLKSMDELKALYRFWQL